MEDLYFNGEKLLPENLEKARLSFIENQKGCINEVLSGKVRVNDVEDYIKWREGIIKKWENKEFRISLGFLQDAYYFQTGKSIALLP